ncbi:MAG: ATP-binding protein [Solirubrobacteraceae bacterium]
MTTESQVPRHAATLIAEALQDTRIVAVEGPRQAGKSTLCSAIAASAAMRSMTLDEDGARRAADEDPAGFVASLGAHAFIDELQRVPDLVLALKAAVDRDPRPGRFLVTGSANLLLAPRVGDSLAGRVERIPLRPFSQAEIERTRPPAWLDEIWDGAPAPYVETGAVGREAHLGRIVAGGFPASVTRSPRRRRAWIDGYLAALVTRDVPDLVDIRRPDLLPVLLRHLAAGSGSTIAMRPIATALAIDEKTVRTYVRLLELLHLVVSVPAWTPRLAARAVRSPRLFIEDSGLLAHLLGAEEERIALDPAVTGRMYETFVAMELARLLPYTATQPSMMHWRDSHGREVDMLLEDRRGRLLAIEIKAGATPSRSDLRGIAALRALVGERLLAGLVLCTVARTTPLAQRAWAVPIEALWTPRPDPLRHRAGGSEPH